jgi:hypothetical protein
MSEGSNQIRGKDGENDGHGTRRHLDNGRPGCRETKSTDNGAREERDGAVVDHGKEGDEEERPSLRILEEKLLDLVHLECLVLDTRRVDPHVFNGRDLLGFTQEASLHWAVREEEEGRDANQNSQAPLYDDVSYCYYKVDGDNGRTMKRNRICQFSILVELTCWKP